jgi:hypothetical protein
MWQFFLDLGRTLDIENLSNHLMDISLLFYFILAEPQTA